MQVAHVRRGYETGRPCQAALHAKLANKLHAAPCWHKKWIVILTIFLLFFEPGGSKLNACSHEEVVNTAQDGFCT